MRKEGWASQGPQQVWLPGAIRATQLVVHNYPTRVTSACQYCDKRQSALTPLAATMSCPSLAQSLAHRWLRSKKSLQTDSMNGRISRT